MSYLCSDDIIHSVSRLPSLVILLLMWSRWTAGRIPVTIIWSRHRTTLVLLLRHRSILLVPWRSTPCILVITVSAAVVVVAIVVRRRRGTWRVGWRLLRVVHHAIGRRITWPVGTGLVRTGGVPVLIEGRGTGRFALDGASPRRTPITFPGRIAAIVRTAAPVVIHVVVWLKTVNKGNNYNME